MNALVHPAPQLVIVWRVWDGCNLACKFCGYSRELSWPRTAAVPAEVLRLGELLSDVQRQTGRSTLVSWLGGEPLLWSSLLPLSRVLRREFGLRLGVTTNGLPLIDPRVRHSLIADFEQITVSIDGDAAFHDEVRGQAGLFAQLEHHIAALRVEDVHGRLWRRVNTVLMRGNIERFADFAHSMANWGFQELTFNQLGGNERPEFYPPNRLLPEQVERFVENLPRLRTVMAKRGLQISGSEQYLQRIRATTANNTITIDDCQPGAEFLFIDPQGRVSPCSFTTAGYSIPLTEIQSVDQFRELPERFAALRTRCRLAACADCHATHVFAKFERPTKHPASWQRQPQEAP